MKKDLQDHLNKALKDGETDIFLEGLRDLIKSRKIGIAELARETGINRPHLYRLLHTDGNPTLNHLISILKYLNFHLSINPS